jgi:cytochrome c
MYKSILTHINDESRVGRLVGMGADLAQRFQAHLTALCLLPPKPPIPLPFAKSFVGQLLAAYREEAERAHRAFARLKRSARSAARVVAAFMCFLAMMPATKAEDGAVLKRGRAIAALKCAHCHAIGRDDERPHAIVIPFRDFHIRYPIEMLMDAKASGVIGGHDEMPMFELSREDMHALLSYIDSLAPAKPGYAKP